MKKYRCHKVVEAAKIVGVADADNGVDGWLIIARDDPETPLGYVDPVRVSSAYLERCRPQVGGYYVKYQDGYESWCPAEAFEEGYEERA